MNYLVIHLQSYGQACSLMLKKEVYDEFKPFKFVEELFLLRVYT